LNGLSRSYMTLYWKRPHRGLTGLILMSLLKYLPPSLSRPYLAPSFMVLNTIPALGTIGVIWLPI